MYGPLNSWKACTVCMIRLKKITGVMSGIVMRKNCCHFDAPSISAASYSEVGTFCSAARKITMAEPNCQVLSSTMVHIE